MELNCGKSFLQHLFDENQINQNEIIQIKKYVSGSRAEKTNQNYERKIKCFEEFCNSNKFNVLPISPRVILKFLVYLDLIGKGKLAADYLNAIRHHAGDNGYSDILPTIVVRAAQGLKRISRLNDNDKEESKSQPFIISSLRNYYFNFKNDSNFIFLRNCALIALSIRLILRASESTALMFEDFKFFRSYLDVKLRRSKTDQYS